MKVCTDACVLGAYANVGSPATKTILDIGTGTGLLALMAAQRNPTALIDAVEIDPDAAAQAGENVAASPFANRVRVTKTAIQEYHPSLLYDRILTNPPFYTNSLRSPNAAINRALHTSELPFGELIGAVDRLLKPDGQWWVLLPPYETQKLTELAASNGLHPFCRLQLRHNENKPPFRIVTGFCRRPTDTTDETLTIYEPQESVYTDAFRLLLQDFYLIF